jgi:hypothetical protein
MLELKPARLPRGWLTIAPSVLCIACALDSRTPTSSDDDEGFGPGNGGAPSGSAVTGGTGGSALPVQVGSDTSLPAPSAGGSSNGSGTPPESAGGAGGAGGGGSAGAAAGGAGGGGAGGATAADAPPAGPAGPCALRLLDATLVSFDAVLSTVALDLATLDEEDALTTRYLALTNRQSAGAPTCELDANSRLLLQVLDSLTLDTTVPGPVRLPGVPLIYRIDLRAFNWDVGVALRGVDYSDTWEGITAPDSSPYAVSFVGDAADDAIIDSGTVTPVLLVDALLDQMLDGVPPFPPGVLATLRADPELLPSLDRLSTPVEVQDAAGDLGVSRFDLADNLNLLDPAFAVLVNNGTLERAAYAPLYRPALCVLSAASENAVDPGYCP